MKTFTYYVQQTVKTQAGELCKNVVTCAPGNPRALLTNLVKVNRVWGRTIVLTH